jgi:hypothetical protein
MRQWVIDSNPSNSDSGTPDGGAQRARRQWVRANFAQIFGTTAEELQARGIDPRQYARQHRHQIRQFARWQRSQGVIVPSGRSSNTTGRAGTEPTGEGPTSGGYGFRYGSGGGSRYRLGRRGGSAWIGILVALLALRFLLVDSFVGAHAAIWWVLIIGGIVLAARVVLFSWLRRRRFNRSPSDGQPHPPSGF